MNLKKIISLSLISSMLGYMIFLGAEGAVVNADTTATSTTAASVSNVVSLNVTNEISLTCPTATSLGSLSGLTGGTASNSVVCNVKTNDSSGYAVTVNATNTPALISGSNTFSDYRTTTPEYAFTQNSTASSSFGFAVSSTAVATAFKNNGATCGTGSNVGFANCFRAFSSSTPITVSDPTAAGSATSVSGVNFGFNFQAQIGTTAVQPSGTYTATVVVTATNS